VNQWAVVWADESIANANIVFKGTQFSESAMNNKLRNWSISLPLKYEKTMAQVKEESIVKAGARLAHVLKSVWPDE